ncbi:pantoate--beta-alanine ligase [bacterium]|nr:pantoate--beta-alanine ligase [bacterium]
MESSADTSASARVVTTPAEMHRVADEIRAAGRTIGFVPTMGYLHDGHLQLLRKARELADVVILSIFVNPTQFSANEDLGAYPRDFERDKALAEAEGTQIIYNPSPESMYPEGFQTQVNLPGMTNVLCGVSRPHHFPGVAQVCAKLFNAVKPHFAVFGLKDFQQYLVVTQMVKDLDMDLKVVGIPIVREKDGLAMSSRNVYMTPAEREQAVVLNQSIKLAEKAVAEGERDAARLLDLVRGHIATAPAADIDYVEIRSIPGLATVEGRIEKPVLLAMAVKFGKARLLDNTVLLREQPNANV